jgi:hypothetical protein
MEHTATNAEWNRRETSRTKDNMTWSLFELVWNITDLIASALELLIDFFL